MGSVATNAEQVCLMMIEHECIGYHRLMCLVGRALRIGSVDGTRIALYLSIPRSNPLVAVNHCPHPWPAVLQAFSHFSCSCLATKSLLTLATSVMPTLTW